MKMSFVDFLTKTVCGIFLLTIVSGLIGTLLSYFLSRLFRKIAKHYKRKRYIKFLVKSGKFFGQGSRAAYAQSKSSFHQILLVGDYLMKLLLSLGKIMLLGIITMVLLIILKDYWFSYPVIIVIASFFISIEYRRIREIKILYHETFKIIYGEEYFNKEMDGIKEYWDKTTKNNEKQ